ncbi:MAG TPA: hypothetical protein VJU79_04155 [Candidatus Dormibacteraeota bacterium]|nr:hypothetical protein [Candidatus Dormibacteraeota bacterium]
MASIPPTGPPQPPSGPPWGGYPTTPPQYAAQYAGAGPPPFAFTARRRTGFLLLAQILAILEGIAFLLIGIGFILLAVLARGRLQQAIENLRGNTSGIDLNRLADIAVGVFIGIGVFLIVYFAFFIWAAVRSGRPSMGARVVVVILDIILVLFSILGFAGRNSSSLSANGTYVIGYLVFWAWQALILLGMTVVATRPVAPAYGGPR